jgi:hypothetical protein
MEELPGTDANALSKINPRQRARLFRQVAEDRADDAGVNGIYVLVTTNPRNVVLVGWPAWRELEDRPLEDGGGLSSTKREKKMRIPFAREVGGDPDGALLRLVDHFRMALKERVSPPPSPLETVPAAIVIGVLIGAWVLLSLIRRAVARRQAAATGEPCRPLYHPAMLGSLFGLPAGFWIYDRLFRSERPPVAKGDAEPPAPLPPEAPVAEEASAPAEVTEGPMV